MSNRLNVIRIGLVLMLFCLIAPLQLIAQEELYGNWQGKMRSLNGKYVFNLDIHPSADKHNALAAVAIHDRKGKKEVIELRGTVYSDFSIYFTDVRDRHLQAEKGEKYSKLQFVVKYKKGQTFLEGHWQEYENLRRYRKGKLVLKRNKRKA